MIALNKTVNLKSDFPDYTSLTCLISGIMMVVGGLIFGAKDSTKNHS